nr:F-box/kelch-repeat protein At1g30090 [Ipomoea trifida]GMD03128.1 F-box/kelch-repeat protein At1g30090 [Ipomoea batatas]GMD05350.1 F-box/kelch-repeat protein At1g30090 [Ipomoea batatas]GME21614.1 F-box/kelch-repeat protein At1g30090 [Ipomoea batatas]
MQRVRVSSQQSPVHKLGDSHMTLSPKFRIAGVGSTLLDPSLDNELAMKGEPLIPGLPDDVALNCLLRVPVDNHLRCRAVCKRWYLLFGNKERFFSRRKELSFHNPWLFVFAFHKCTGKIEWKVFDLTSFSWHTIPAMPCKDKVIPHGFRCISMPHEGVMFVCGGLVSDTDCPLNLVLKYEVGTNRWTVLKSMITPRSFFGSGVIDGMIYVAGGNSSDLFELNSAEVLDPYSGTWRSVSNIGIYMSSYDAAVLNGKLFITEGWFWPFYVVPRGQIYDPKTDNWEGMPSGLREGWTGSSVVIDGHLFVVSEHERAKVKVYNFETDNWDMIDGPPLPELICKPFCVNCCGNRIIVVGQNLNIAVGHVTRRQQSEMSNFNVEWEVMDAPDSLSELSPSSAQVLFA